MPFISPHHPASLRAWVPHGWVGTSRQAPPLISPTMLVSTSTRSPSDPENLAGDAVENFERFRAPLSDDELARKNSPALTEKQRIYLNTFGYPHVKEYFRFHITLTGPLSPDQSSSVSTLLLDYLQPACLRPFTIDSLSLCGEASNGYFHEIDRFALGKATNSV